MTAAEPARRFLARVRAGEVEACTSTEVLHEILYRYVALRRLDLAREVYDLFVSLCPVVLPVTLADTDRAKQLLDGRVIAHVAVEPGVGVAPFLRGPAEQGHVQRESLTWLRVAFAVQSAQAIKSALVTRRGCRTAFLHTPEQHPQMRYQAQLLRKSARQEK